MDPQQQQSTMDEHKNGLPNGELLSAASQPNGPISCIANELFKVDWNPIVEHRRYITMEGHMEMYNEHETEPDQIWKRLYFRTKDGRFQWFSCHCADEHPISDILLTGAEVKANKEDWTLKVKGGKENADLLVKVPSNVFEKWHQTLLNHAHSVLVDAYIQPVLPPNPHRTNKVVLLELGGQAIRAGILTQKPSLPYTFIPNLCAIDDQGNDHMRFLAGTQEALGKGLTRLIQPIQMNDAEATKLDKQAMMALLQKVRENTAAEAKSMDIRFRAQDYSVLLSIPQHMDIVPATEIFKMLLDKAIGFKSISIVRQPSLVLYSYDVTTGIVIELGEHFSIIPVIDEFVVEEAVEPIPYGAKQIREYVKKRVDIQSALPQGQQSPIAEELLLRFVIEKTCYVAAGGERGSKNTVAELEVDGQRMAIPVDAETRHAAVEGLFKPKQWGLEVDGLPKLVHEAIQRCPIDSRRPLYRAIYLTGGTSLLPGLAERLEKELAQLVPPSIAVQVLNSPWRRHSAFLGAHPIAAADEFPNCCAGEADIGDYLRRMSSAT